MTLPLAGQIIRASDITQYATRYISKPGTESVTSSIVIQNDDDFVVTLTPGVWEVVLIGHTTAVNSTVAGGIRAAWSNTGTMTSLGRACEGVGFGGSSQSTTVGSNSARWTAHNLGTEVQYGGHGNSTAIVREEILVQVTATGVLQLQWAQAVSSATASTFSSASRLFYRLVELP